MYLVGVFVSCCFYCLAFARYRGTVLLKCCCVIFSPRFYPQAPSFCFELHAHSRVHLVRFFFSEWYGVMLYVNGRYGVRQYVTVHARLFDQLCRNGVGAAVLELGPLTIKETPPPSPAQPIK